MDSNGHDHMGFLARRRLRALRYLFKSEKHESRIGSDRDDYDTYWIYLERTERRGFLNQDDPTDPQIELVRMIVHPSKDGPITISRMKRTEDDAPPSQSLTEQIASEAKFEVIHYFKDAQLSYSSPITAALLRLLGLHHVQFWLSNLSNRLLARRIKPVKYRLQVLEAVIELHEERYGEIRFFTVSHKLLGPKLANIRHPNTRDHWRQVINILDSLVHTGELKQGGEPGSYLPTGKAYASLMDWQREVEEKRAQLRREAFVIVLTFFIAVGTLAQAFGGH